MKLNLKTKFINYLNLEYLNINYLIAIIIGVLISLFLAGIIINFAGTILIYIIYFLVIGAIIASYMDGDDIKNYILVGGTTLIIIMNLFLYLNRENTYIIQNIQVKFKTNIHDKQKAKMYIINDNNEELFVKNISCYNESIDKLNLRFKDKSCVKFNLEYIPFFKYDKNLILLNKQECKDTK